MADIYTIGGGEIIYGVLNAVSLLLNGGSGTLRALITIGAVWRFRSGMVKERTRI